MSNQSYKRILHRDKPKADIIESQVKTFFRDTDCEEALITIAPNNKSRSTKQNALYWSWLSILQETGNTQMALHTYLASEFLEPEIEEVQGRPVLVIKSTTQLSVKEMGEYLLHVEEFADDIGVNLPRPEDWLTLVN